MSYTIELLPSAQRDLARLDRRDQQRVAKAIDALAQDPLPPGAKTLKGQSQKYRRIRVGSCRVVYTVEGDRLVVLVVRIGQRGQVYKKLP